MDNIYLKPMTDKMYHEYFKEYENDYDLFLDILTNTRSQHVLEKVGFQKVGEDERSFYYKIER